MRVSPACPPPLSEWPRCHAAFSLDVVCGAGAACCACFPPPAAGRRRQAICASVVGKRLGSAPIKKWRVRLSHADDLKLSSLHSRAVFHVSGPKPIILYRAMDPLAAAGLCDFFQRWSGCVLLLLCVWCGSSDCSTFPWPCLPSIVAAGVVCVVSSCSYSQATWHQSRASESSLWARSISLPSLVPLAVFCFFECNECAVAMRPLHSGCVWLLPWACCDHAVFPGAFVVLAK